MATQGPCIELVAAFFPATPETDIPPPGDITPTPWAELFRDLYSFATGWMGWPPETAWSATPQEITDAFNAHMVKPNTIYGGAAIRTATAPPTRSNASRTSSWVSTPSSTGLALAA